MDFYRNSNKMGRVHLIINLSLIVIPSIFSIVMLYSAQNVISKTEKRFFKNNFIPLKNMSFRTEPPSLTDLVSCMMKQAVEGEEPSFTMPYYPGSEYEKMINQHGFSFWNGRIRCYAPRGNIYEKEEKYGEKVWNTFVRRAYEVKEKETGKNN